ncbi:HNH endonuclease family protein [Streptomyces luteolus]|uniref:HNH endonuclease family protein n=1 Tax=Streptomyces luteolus TaxID=3043615 RepID=A0ABT6SX78_9ACTN|nr:HNH endonuclease family protein [Streptomyces sp. B-S-A12]MDI3420213.1 HNH endonuclease family protein [Streptomyces sp. B-S-A12]
MRARATGPVAALLAVAALAAACTPLQVERADSRFNEPSAQAGTPNGTRPAPRPNSLPPTPERNAQGFPPTAATARDQLARLDVARGRNWQTYRRAEFGATWSDEVDVPGGRNGCDTRDDVLRRDLKELREGDRNPCVVLSGTLDDPYTGKQLPYHYRRASRIETDHVVALGAAWRAGAWAWTPRQRLNYANDLDVLLAVDKQANADKSSKTPDKWQPRRAYRCEYARRWTAIKARYRLTVTEPEKRSLRNMLSTCPG